MEPADPDFRERLRAMLWKLVQLQRKPKAETRRTPARPAEDASQTGTVSDLFPVTA